MNEAITPAGLLLSLSLPWLAGSLCVHALLRRRGADYLCIVVGHGYFAGLFGTTLLMRAWDAAGLPLSFPAIATCLTAIALGAVLAMRRWPAQRCEAGAPAARISVCETALALLLLALIAWRYLTLWGELSTLPLYPWDAWMNWAPKAIVWQHFGQLLPFVEPWDWVIYSGETPHYTLGNLAAWRYPPTVPLIHLWTMAGAGTSDHSLLQLPWLCVALSMGLALYGHLRMLHLPVLPALLAAYLFLNLPYVNVHSVLAGYADLWLAAAFGLGAMALQEWSRTRRKAWGLLVLLMALACSQLKLPGVVLGAILLLALTVSWLSPPRAVMAGLCIAAALSAVLAAVFGLSLELPYLGSVKFEGGQLSLPYMGSFSLAYHPVLGAIGESLFGMRNWNLLAYLCLLAAPLMVLDHRHSRALLPVICCLLMVLAFLATVFVFTDYARSAADFTAINRSLLYLVLPAIYTLFAWHALRCARHLPLTPAQTTAT